MQEQQENAEYISNMCAVINPEEFTTEKILEVINSDFYNFTAGLEYSREIRGSDGIHFIIKTLQEYKYLNG